MVGSSSAWKMEVSRIPGSCSPNMMNTMPLNTNSSIAQTLLARRRIASGALRITPDWLMVIPAATAARMPETPICSAIR
ncbi:hypothetical protein D3C78_1574640 [compost metagenome]